VADDHQSAGAGFEETNAAQDEGATMRLQLGFRHQHLASAWATE
jgi:hypothetical protein